MGRKLAINQFKMFGWYSQRLFDVKEELLAPHEAHMAEEAALLQHYLGGAVLGAPDGRRELFPAKVAYIWET